MMATLRNTLTAIANDQPLEGYRALLATTGGALFTAACAQASFYIPGNPVPVTLQVLGVCVCGMLLGARLGAISQIEYLVAGLLGAPVFAGFRAGPAAIMGPTGGYLIAFVPAAFLIGAVATRFRASFHGLVFAGVLGVFVIYVFGRAWLALWLGSPSSLESWVLGVAPFVGVDMAKVVLAAVLCRSVVWRH
ncbi:MAG: biotin transporter BioY [Armatimonadota bacterium]